MAKEEIEEYKKRKYTLIIFVALLVAFLAVIMAQNALDTANINNVYVPVVNNTDLYPSQRTHDVTYWANDSPIDIYLIFHGLGTGAGQAFDSNISINGTVLQDNDFRTSAGAGFHDHWPLSARIPKGANYSVKNSSNVFNIEWREYPVLSGKNGTLSINTSVYESFNATYDAYGSSKLNKTGDTALNLNVTGILNASGGLNTTYLNVTNTGIVGGFVGVGTLNPTSPIQVVRSTTSTQAISVDGYGSFLATIIGRQAGGTPSSPSSTVINDRMFIMGGGGRDNNGFAGASSIITYYATESFTTTAHGSAMRFETTPNQSTTRRTSMSLTNDGNLSMSISGNGFILKSGSGSCYFFNVSNTGTLQTSGTSVTCP